MHTSESVNALFGVVQNPPFQGWLFKITLILEDPIEAVEGVNFSWNYPTY